VRRILERDRVTLNLIETFPRWIVERGKMEFTSSIVASAIGWDIVKVVRADTDTFVPDGFSKSGITVLNEKALNREKLSRDCHGIS
jgi:hypothetical protein